MTSFIDGPAQGQRMTLQRAPIYLRVTVDKAGKWDALDQLEDEPKPDETIYAYVLLEHPGRCHILRTPRSLSGWYVIGKYKLVENQPSDDELRDSDKWAQWTATQGWPNHLPNHL